MRVAKKPFEMLLDALKSADPLVAADAARLLGELGRREAVPALVDYVRTSRHYHKAGGYHALGQIGDRSAIPVLRKLVADPGVRDDWYWYGCRAVRAGAAVALLALGDDGGADYLRELAEKSNDVFYCWFGPTILRLPGSTPGARELRGRLTVEALLSPVPRSTRLSEPGLMSMKAEALGLLGGEAACAELMGLMKFHSRYVRGAAALALMTASRAPEHVAAVAALADCDPTEFVRIKASLALAQAGQAERAEFIAEMAGKAADAFDRAVAVEALGILGDGQYAAAVSRQLKHADTYVRQCALEALERIDPSRAARAARGMAKDKSPRVRLQAAKILAAEAGK